MKKNKVFSASSLPRRLPIMSTITAWLALDHWNAPQWLYGAVGILYLGLWLDCIYHMGSDEKVDILKNEEEKK